MVEAFHLCPFGRVGLYSSDHPDAIETRWPGGARNVTPTAVVFVDMLAFVDVAVNVRAESADKLTFPTFVLVLTLSDIISVI